MPSSQASEGGALTDVVVPLSWLATPSGRVVSSFRGCSSAGATAPAVEGAGRRRELLAGGTLERTLRASCMETRCNACAASRAVAGRLR